jgi:hypothetical protein
MEELVRADLRGDAGHQHEENELARERRIGGFHGLEEDDVAEDLRRRETQCEASFDLAPANRFDARPDDLGQVGADIDRQSHDRRLPRVEPDADRG